MICSDLYAHRSLPPTMREIPDNFGRKFGIFELTIGKIVDAASADINSIVVSADVSFLNFMQRSIVRINTTAIQTNGGIMY